MTMESARKRFRARRDPDFMIIARTDAASGRGLDAAIKRVQAFMKF